MNMKKRSQSSLRSKTLQSESDPNEQNFWIGNLPKPKQKIHPNIASSMIEQSNKENTESNIQNCQSVQQLSNRSEIMNRTPISYKSIHAGRKEYSAMQVTPVSYVKNSVGELNVGDVRGGEKDGQQVVAGFGPFNYVQQYYQVQIQALNSKINQMGTELRKYRQLYSSKQSQLQDLSDGLSQRISKQNNEKNVLIKQINSNNIEIKRLRQEVNLHKSEKESFKMVLKQKQTVIEELNSSIIQIQLKKKKIETYQIQLRQTQSTLQQIEVQTHKLRQETIQKDQIIKQSNKKISSLEQKLMVYEQQIKELERNTLNLKQNTNHSQHRIEQAQKQCEEWKNKYCQVKVQLEDFAELKAKLKNYQGIVQELQGRVKELVGANQKFKIQVAGLTQYKGRSLEMEKELASLKKMLRSKCEELQALQGTTTTIQKMQQQIDYCRTRITTLQSESSQKDHQTRQQKQKILQLTQQLSNLQQQLHQYEKQPSRIKELQQKIDTLFSQNQNLHQSLLEKISEIQDLQRKVNILQSKNIISGNQCVRVKAMYDGLSEQFSELESKLENMKARWESQLGAKLGLEEKCNRVSKEVVGLRVQLAGAEETNRKLMERMEQISQQFQDKRQQLYIQLEQLNTYKQQAQTQLQQSNIKTQQLRQSLQQLRSQIQEHSKRHIKSMTKIKELENTMNELEEELRKSRQNENKMKKYWRDVSGICDIVLGEDHKI